MDKLAGTQKRTGRQISMRVERRNSPRPETCSSVCDIRSQTVATKEKRSASAIPRSNWIQKKSDKPLAVIFHFRRALSRISRMH